MIYLVISIIIIAATSVIFTGKVKNGGPKNSTRRRAVKCRNCGSPARIRGSHWECPYCGDSGRM